MWVLLGRRCGRDRGGAVSAGCGVAAGGIVLGLGLLRYLGAKKRLGRWVAEHLPVRELYVEPFGGMLGVLLARVPAGYEIVNDLDGLVFDWWRCVRDRPGELADRLAGTPYGERAYEEAVRLVGDDDLVVRSAAVAVLLHQGYVPSLGVKKGQWSWAACSPQQWGHLPAQVREVAGRLADVRLLCRDGVDVLREFGGRDDAVIYCDPPYAERTGYGVEVAYEAMGDALLGCSAAVAVSGFPSCPWADVLADWAVVTRERGNSLSVDAGRRDVECLWMNYEPPGRLW